MTGQPPAHGRDEITLTAPAGDLCISLQHYRESRPVHVVAVTFGELGTHHPGAVWPDCWYDIYPGCAVCWLTTDQVASQRRRGPTVQRTASPPAAPTAQD